MSTPKLNQNEISSSEAHLESWLIAIISTLKVHWGNYQAVNQSRPDFKAWLNLIHSAATSPDKLVKEVARFLEALQNIPADSYRWGILTDLLALTFEAAKSEANKLSSGDWQNLLEIQTRILKAAAQVVDRTTTPQAGHILDPQTVAQINKAITNISDPYQLLDALIGIIQQKFGYQYINIFLLDANKKSLTLQNSTRKTNPSETKQVIILKAGEGIMGQVVSTRQSMLVNDVFAHPHFVPQQALARVKSQIAIPLQAGENLLGVLDIESERLDAFSENDHHLLESISGLIAITLTNAYLQKVQQRYQREQNLIYESVITLGTGMDMETVLQHISQKITEIISVGACVICQIDDKNQTITAISEYIAPHFGQPNYTWREFNQAMPIAKDPISQQILKTVRPVISTGKADRTLIWQAPANTTPDSRRWNMLLALPFETKMRVSGMIEIYDINPKRTFSSEDIQICRILATQTALALEQTRLFDEMLRRLSEMSMLYDMAQKLSSSLELEDILHTIVTSLKEAMGCRACCIFLIDSSHTALEIKAAVGLKPQWREAAKLKLGQGAAGIAAAEGRTVYLPDTLNDPDFVVFDPEVKSLLAVPLIAHGKIIGTINVDDNKLDAFEGDQERSLTIAAAQAGAAIENARLFARVTAEQQQLQAIMQHMADGLLLTDKQGDIITCNSTLAMMLGLRHKEIVGKNVNTPDLPPNLALIMTSATRRARTGVLAKEVTIENPRPRTLQIFTTAVFDNQNNQVGEVRLVHDVTKERELDQLKDDFISTISHELRTPLFSIQGFAQLMMEADDLDLETQNEFLSTIRRQAIQLSQMVNNLLDISKFDEGKMGLEKTSVSMMDIINQTILKLQGFAHHQNIKLLSDLPLSLPPLMGDPQRLEQVLTNLIGNAIKFSKDNEQVVVKATAIIKTSADDAEIMVQVKDQGIGISPDALSQIFSRYYQVHDKSERSAMGSGLGLHIAKKIVEGHGGRIWAESEVGQGSTFCFSLPTSGITVKSEK